MQLGRRHRAVALGLAALAAGVFVIFLTRVYLLSPPKIPLRTCTASNLFQGLTFPEMQKRYHWTMDQLMEERMRLLAGDAVLSCSEKRLENVIPAGQLASSTAKLLPHVSDPPLFKYSDFELLLTELWRTYDCHLFAAQSDPAFLAIAFGVPIAVPTGVGTLDVSSSILYSGATYAAHTVIEQEKLRARATLDRLLFSLRSSEQYLPLHASLRCLQRGGTDLRNAFALLADAASCFPAKLSQPETSLRKP